MNNDPVTNKWRSYTNFLRRYDWLIILISIALFVITINYVRQIKVVSNFKAMLPEKAESVVQLNKIEKRVRGTDNLIVLAGGSNWTLLKKFVDDFTVRLLKDYPNRIERLEFDVSQIKKFYDDNKYLYIDLTDLKEIHDRLEVKINYEKLKELPFFVDLGEEEPEFTTEDIEEKYKKQGTGYKKYHDNYLTNPDGTLAAIIIWPREGATDISFTKQLISDLRKTAESMDLKKYDPNLQIAFGGRLRKMIVEYNAVIGDMLLTSLLCLAMVGLVVLIYFRKLRMGFLMTVNVAQGTLVALAIAFFTIGYFTASTAFLGAIIVGNGIDFSLIMMSRYLEEKREQNKNTSEAMLIALAHTWRPTLTSSLTTAAAFFALTATDIKGFSQFGFIGGIGMPLCWLSTFFFLPAWLSISERIWSIRSALRETCDKNRFMDKLTHLVVKREKNMLKMGAALIISCIVFAVWFIPNSLEYNFDKLKFKPVKEENNWGAFARHELKHRIFGGQSTTPSVVIARDVNEAEEICKAIKESDRELGWGYVERCKTLATYIPEDQDEKLETLASMRELLSGSTLKFLNEEQLEEVEKLKDTLDMKPIAVEDLPDEITRIFSDIDGNKGVITFVYPKADLWNGHELMKFADIFRKIDLPNSSTTIHSSGQPVILADLLRSIVEEGPKVTLLSLLCVMLLVWINFRRIPETLLITSSLITGVIILLGLMSIIDIKLNFLNFIALPITFGIGVDYAVNVYQRIKQDGFKNITHSLGRISSAVIFCSATTTIGYSVLLTSRSQALVSFGVVALLGEIVCLLVAVFLLPLVIIRLYNAGLMPFPKHVKLKDIILAVVKPKNIEVEQLTSRPID